jgi:hypothetical protein
MTVPIGVDSFRMRARSSCIHTGSSSCRRVGTPAYLTNKQAGSSHAARDRQPQPIETLGRDQPGPHYNPTSPVSMAGLATKKFRVASLRLHYLRNGGNHFAHGGAFIFLISSIPCVWTISSCVLPIILRSSSDSRCCCWGSGKAIP